MSFTISGNVVTGSVNQDVVAAAIPSGKTFIDVKLSGGYRDITFYDSTFMNATFSRMVNVKFVRCEFLRADFSYEPHTGVELTDCTQRHLYLPRKIDEIKGITQPAMPQGNITFFKKVDNQKIATLMVPAEAKRTKAYGTKCRAEFAFVVGIVDKYGNPVTTGNSLYNPSFKYEVGKIVKPEREFSDMWWEECASGIHGFLNVEDARNFYY